MPRRELLKDVRFDDERFDDDPQLRERFDGGGVIMWGLVAVMVVVLIGMATCS